MYLVVGLAVILGLIALRVAPARLSAYLMQIEKRIMAGWRLPPQSEGRKITLRMKLSPGGYTS